MKAIFMPQAMVMGGGERRELEEEGGDGACAKGRNPGTVPMA